MSDILIWLLFAYTALLAAAYPWLTNGNFPKKVKLIGFIIGLPPFSLWLILGTVATLNTWQIWKDFDYFPFFTAQIFIPLTLLLVANYFVAVGFDLKRVHDAHRRHKEAMKVSA